MWLGAGAGVGGWLGKVLLFAFDLDSRTQKGPGQGLHEASLYLGV